MIEIGLDHETLQCLGVRLANDEWRLFLNESDLGQAAAPMSLSAGPSLFLPAVPPQPISAQHEMIKRAGAETIPRKLYTAKETAGMLAITEAQLLEFVRVGEISYVAIGLGQKKMRRGFEPEDIDKFLAARRRTEEWPKHPVPSRSGRGPRSFSIGSAEVDESFMSRLKRRRAERRSATNNASTKLP
jgi:hypothetical protein